MDDLEPALLVIPLVAVVAPLLARLAGRWVRVPIVVFELVLGILIGPSVLGWALPSPLIETLSDFGLAMLFFVAGTEIEFGAFSGRTGRRAIGGWLLSLAIGVAAGFLLDPGEAAVVIGVALSSTALGALIPILRDARELSTPFGRSIGAIGAIGEFGPLVAISVFLGGRDPGIATAVLAAFVLIAGGAITWAVRVPRGALHRAVNLSLHTSGQFAVRAVFLILAALVALSIALDLDMLLGAFVAGVIWRLMMRDAAPADREAVDSKIEGVAFGFLVPVFFIYTGVTFDIRSLVADPWLFTLLPLGLVALLVIRGIPASLAVPAGSSTRDRIATALLGATALPIIVAVTSIAVGEQIITGAQAAVLVGTGMLSVLVFPLLAMIIRREPAAVREPADSDEE